MAAPSLPSVSFRLTTRDLELLEEIRRAEGLASRVEALRFALRECRRRERPVSSIFPQMKMKKRRGR